jgi:hypothetical protein
MSNSQASMSFIQQPADAEVKHETIDATSVVTELPTLKRRVHNTGARHGKAFGSIGVVTTAYTKGFAEGFVSAFRD